MSSRKQTYYGAFFWLGLAAFAAPVFVGLFAFREVPEIHAKPPFSPDASGVDHGQWDYLLKTYVQDGLIDYDGLGRDYLLPEYLAQLGRAAPHELATDAERLALLCNAYNAFVVSGVINHRIGDTVMTYKTEQGVGFFDRKEYVLAGETLSLNQLEHERVRPVFNDPRIHMALVCAARSCPVIRREAFIGANLERQFEDQAILFVNDPVHVRYDADADTLHVSAILQWYGEDFEAGGGFLAFLLARASDAGLREGIQAAISGKAKVVFNEYDWALNAQEPRPTGRQPVETDFGSGSIPGE